MSKENYDIFISNLVYPDAQAIFQFHLKPLNEIKDDCYVVVDTNALLVPYTVNPKSLQEIRNTYLKLVESKRLIIPGQVAREFARNRASKVSELYQQLSKKRDAQGLPRLEPYPLLESMSEFKEALELSSKIDSYTREYRKKLGEVLSRIKDWIWDDPVSLIYRELFSADVVVDLPIDDKVKEEIEKDLDNRSTHSIAPGYKDSSKPDKGVGDLLIWRTILDTAYKHSKSVIFVSIDEKSDWWYQSEKQALYPRYELVDEFRRASNQQSFHIVTFSRFLELYGASQDVINEVRREEQVKIFFNDDYDDDNYIRYLNSLSIGEQEQEIDNKIADTYQQIVDTEEVVGAMAETNAFSWSVDDYKVTEIDVGEDECTVLLTYSASGDQDEDRGFCGNKINGEAKATIDESGDVTYEIINAEVEDWGED